MWARVMVTSPSGIPSAAKKKSRLMPMRISGTTSGV
jgi:hypothetical protein